MKNPRGREREKEPKKTKKKSENNKNIFAFDFGGDNGISIIRERARPRNGVFLEQNVPRGSY